MSVKSTKNQEKRQKILLLQLFLLPIFNNSVNFVNKTKTSNFLFQILIFSFSSGRSFGRASHLDEKFGSFEELQEAIDHQLSKYMSALDSDRCMDRIVCELGVKASNIPHKSLFFR